MLPEPPESSPIPDSAASTAASPLAIDAADLVPPATDPARATAIDPADDPGAPPWALFLGALAIWAGSQVVGLVVALVVTAIVRLPYPDPSDPRIPPGFLKGLFDDPLFVALTLWLSLLSAIALLVAFTRGAHGGWHVRLGLVRGLLPAREYVTVVASCFAVLFIGITLIDALIVLRVLPEIGPSREFIRSLFFSGPPSYRVAMVIGGSVLTGCFEEMLFRGFLQRGLLRRWRPRVALPVVVVAFALAHGDPTYDVFVLPVGIWLCWLAWRTGSILPGIAGHITVNGTFQSLIAIHGSARQASRPEHIFGAGHAPVALALPLLLALAGLAWLGFRRVERCVREVELSPPTASEIAAIEPLT